MTCFVIVVRILGDMKNEIGFWKVSVMAVAVGASAFTCGGSDEELDGGSTEPPVLGKVVIRVLAPQPHSEVRSPVPFELEAEGVTIAPAAELEPGKGYLVIAVDGRCTPANQAIAKDSRHVHLLLGERRAAVNVPPGMRDLCVQVAYGDGRAYDGSAELTLYVY